MRIIDADALMDKFKRWLPKDPQEGGTEVENIAVSALMEIEEAPTVDAVAVMHGEWTANMTIINDGQSYCSICGAVEPDTTANYCPNCGCKMTEGELNVKK